MRAALDTLLAALGAHAPEYKAALADYLTAKVHCVVCTTAAVVTPLSPTRLPGQSGRGAASLCWQHRPLVCPQPQLRLGILSHIVFGCL
jgi:hypothetical protein